MRLEDLVDQEQIGEERPEVNGCVQVVDQLRADGRLRQHELDRGEGRLRVANEHVVERWDENDATETTFDD